MNLFIGLKDRVISWYSKRLQNKLESIDKAENEMVDYVVHVEGEIQESPLTPEQVMSIHLPMIELKAKHIGLALRWYWGASADKAVEEEGKRSLDKVLKEASRQIGRPLHKVFKY